MGTQRTGMFSFKRCTSPESGVGTASSFMKRRSSPVSGAQPVNDVPWDMRPLAQMRHIDLRIGRFRELTPKLLQHGVLSLALLGFGAISASCFAFGGFFYACGSDCFVLSSGNSFSYLEMVWMSIHTFTSIGYGSTYPTCTVAQILVLLEYFSSIVVSSLVISIFLFKFLRPHPLVRFSENCLCIDNVFVDGDTVFRAHSRRVSQLEGKHLNFRIVRESYYPLTDCRLTVSCVLRKRTGKGGNVVSLKLRSHEVHRLEVWDVWHEIDEESPLYGNLDLLKQVTVRLTVMDSVYNQKVRLSHEYGPAALRNNMQFVEMISAVDKENNCCFVDHSKMDALEATVKLDDHSHQAVMHDAMGYAV